AIFGERLSIDINNMMSDVCESITNEFQSQRDYEGFRLDLARRLSIESPVTEQEFMNEKSDVISDKVFAEAQRYYKHKSQMLMERTRPFVTDVYTGQGATIQNIVVPFSDGMKGIQIVANLKKAYDSKGRELAS